ncbi:MAG: hypothetical protein ACK5MT_02500 [Actinomycetales bacterium]
MDIKNPFATLAALAEKAAEKPSVIWSRFDDADQDEVVIPWCFTRVAVEPGLI